MWLSTWDQWAALAWLFISTLPAVLWVPHGLARLRAGAMRADVFGLGILVPLPVWLATRLYRPALSAVQGKNAMRLYSTLTAPYRSKFWYWEAVLLFQRQGFGLLSLLLSWDLVIRAYAMCLFSGALLVAHVHTRPFCSKVANLLQSVALLSLVAASASTAVSAYGMDNGVAVNWHIQLMNGLATSLLSIVPLGAIFSASRPLLSNHVFSGSSNAQLEVPLLGPM